MARSAKSMHAEPLVWAEDVTEPLVEHFCFSDPAANAVIVGTGHFKAGQLMPASGFSQHSMREISVILEGAISTESGGKAVILKAGDIVTIPPNQKQVSRFLEDTRLVYVFFGHRHEACDEDS
jgi:quercetin dioxygenase-like cupin family protein